MGVRERLAEKAARQKIPLMAAMELLPICNLNCKMCYVRKSMEEVNSLGGWKDGDWWLDIAAQAREMGLLYPLLTGGEPFLHPQFKEIMAGMVDMGMQVSINSNATRIDADMADWLSYHPPVRVNVTMYGASEETYRGLCGNGDAFYRMREGVAHLKEKKIPVKFNASITPENVGDLEEMIAYAKAQESPIQVATYMFPPIRRDSAMVGQNQRLSPEEAAYARVKADYLQSDPLWFMGQAERFSRFVPLDQWKENSDVEPMGMRCRAGLCSAWLDWQGNLINCGMYGSVREELKTQSFREAWEKLTEATAQVRYNPFCAGCPNQHLCHPCIAMVNNECGDVNGKPEYMCRMNQAAARYYQQFAREKYPELTNKTIPEFKDRDVCEI